MHTVGSLIGAVSAKTPKPASEMPTAVIGTDKAEPNYSVSKEYWVTLLIMCTVAFPLVLVMEGIRVHEPAEWLLFYAIFLPIIQIAASVFVAIRNTFSKRPGRDERLRHLGYITLRAFVGGVIGILVMLVLFATLK